MNIAARMTVALAACGVLLFGVSGFVQLRQEKHDLEAVAKKEALLLANGVQVAFENALHDSPERGIEETLVGLRHVDPVVQLFVYGHDGSLLGRSEGAEGSPDTERLRNAVETAGPGADVPVEIDDGEDPRVLRLALPLRDAGPRHAAALVLAKPLTEVDRDLAATTRIIVGTTAGFVLAVAALTWLLMRRYVAGPMAQLVRDMKTLRAGRFDVAKAPDRRDEVGAAQLEFEGLVHALEEARARGDRELEARRRVERGLQQADKLITLGQLAAVMAHEVGSPLQILEGRARALLKHADDAHATRRTANMLVEQTERITRIVGQMLSITRRRSASRTRLDANESVRKVVALLEFEARKRGVSLEVEVHGPTDVYADPDQLQQLVLNLLRNALDAAPKGSAVSVSQGGDGATFTLEVLDAGPGISHEQRPHLFEPFFTTKAEQGGSGLGLSVVRAIAQQHGGRIEFPERPQGGCLARVELPRSGGAS